MAASKSQLQALAVQVARKYGVPERGFLALIGRESGWNPSARSPAGALGVAQFMPGTARGLGINPLDPGQALGASAKHLAALRRNLGSWDLALAGYNAGGGAVKKYGGVPPYKETQAYVAALGPVFRDGSPSGITPGGLPAAGAGTVDVAGSQVGASAFGSLDAAKVMALVRAQAQRALAGQMPDAGYLPQLNALVNQGRLAPRVRSVGAGAAAVGGGVTSAAMSGAGIFGGARGKLIGDERAHGARAIGNWQSDRALDLGVKFGTPVYAVADGVIGQRFGALNSRDPKMQGLRLNLEGTAQGNFYYAHLSRFANGIRPGARVRRGQLLGYTGRANGVDHLHIGADRANLRQLLGY